MDAAYILAHTDHTLLAPTATWPDIKKICEEGLRYHTASVCIPSAFVRPAHAAFPNLTICTVVGFPLGHASLAAKEAETRQALADGASEIDMVIAIGALKEGRTDIVTEEIRRLKTLTGPRLLKVIVETCYLATDEKIAACRCCTDGGADFIKTSTGFGPAGAKLSDIALFRAHLGSAVRIKAAGGIRTRKAMEDFLAAGCDRLGASAAVALLAPELDGPA